MSLKAYANQSLSSRNTNSVGRRVRMLRQIPAGGLGFLDEDEEFTVVASGFGGVCVQSGVCKDPVILQEGSYEFV